MKIHFRETELSDLSQILNLLSDLYEGHISLGLEEILRIVIKDETYFALNATVDEQVVGFILGTSRLEIDFECRAGIIESIIVQGKYRSCGIGRGLLDRFAAWAKRQGCAGILVPCGRSGFFERTGFTKYEIQRFWRDMV